MADKLALFMPDFSGGGAERVMLTLAQEFAESGLDVELVVCNAKGPLRDDVPENVRLVDLGASRMINSLMPLVRYMRREKPKTMLAALKATNCIAIGARALARVPTRLVVSEHSTLSIAQAGVSELRWKTLPMLMRWSYPRADAVVAVSNGVADDLSRTIGLARDRIETIYNPVITDDMLARSREPVDHPWFKPGEPPVVLGVGRLVEAKDFPNLIRAFVALRQSRPARLLILGEGPERERLEAMAHDSDCAEDISLPGFVANPYAYMRAASVFVLSSRWEGLPTVLIEALGCGTPVVTTDCPSGPAEICQQGVQGMIVPVDDSNALGVVIGEALDEADDTLISTEALDAFRPQRVRNQYWRLLSGK